MEPCIVFKIHMFYRRKKVVCLRSAMLSFGSKNGVMERSDNHIFLMHVGCFEVYEVYF